MSQFRKIIKFRTDVFYILTPNRSREWNGLRYKCLCLDKMRASYGKENVIVVFDHRNRICKSKKYSTILKYLNY